MNSAEWDYARLCDEELAAADMAPTRGARIAHLEQAFRFAQRAVKTPVADRSNEIAG